MNDNLKKYEEKYNPADLHKKDLEYKSLILSAPSISNKIGIVQYIKRLNNFRKKLMS
jgi:hypothetical protein